ncbi:DNA-binding phosphoprotein [Turkeypox virus]|uniref:Protein OPG079 n=1 Tax=Turkeypox virus TaxID=336486 RepID=A0A0M3ZHU4_9POXV|nr:DNA-binding phosphoprotein [Turkeypox virus]ALA62437.1 DNA-binding phosphoprotein [Turkeypox virus]
MKNNLIEENLVMNKKPIRSLQRRRCNDDSNRFTCKQAVEYAKALCTKDIKIVKSVKLSPSHYKSCSNILVVLEPEFKDKLITPFITADGEAKIYQNRNDSYNKEDSYFLKFRPTLISPILNQIMEHIYTGLNYLDPDNPIEEKTFKDGHLYINGNKMLGGVVEYMHGGRIVGRKPLSEDIEALSKKDPQLAKIVLVASVYYDNDTMCKISFSLKKLIMERICKTTLIDANGEVISIVTSGDDDIVEFEDTEVVEYDNSFVEKQHAISKKITRKLSECDEENTDHVDQPLFSVH